jgi:L-iditol 2-dehydrogenase
MSDFGLVADHRAMLEDGYTGPLPFYKKFYRMPDGFDFIDGAVFLSLSESMSAAHNFGAGPGKKIVVYGAGPMGLALMKYMRVMGTEKIVAVDVVQERLDKAMSLCQVDSVINSAVTSVKEVLGDEKFDIVVDAVGLSSIILEGSQLLKPLGRFGAMGVLKKDDASFDVTRLRNNTMFQLLNLPSGEYDIMKENLELIDAGKINPKDFYSHVLPRENIEECLRLVREKKALKVILTM